MRKKCKDCNNFKSYGATKKYGIRGLALGECVILKEEEIHRERTACSTNFKSVEDYGCYDLPIIFKHKDYSDIRVTGHTEYSTDKKKVEIEIEDDEAIVDIFLGEEELRLLANNILDYLNDKKIEYPSVEIKNNDF